jgi:RecJ-like exonuclease
MDATVNNSGMPSHLVFRHLRDQALRRKGFTIHARPAKGPAVWVKDGTLYTEAQALEAAGVTVVGRATHDG